MQRGRGRLARKAGPRVRLYELATVSKQQPSHEIKRPLYKTTICADRINTEMRLQSKHYIDIRDIRNSLMYPTIISLSYLFVYLIKHPRRYGACFKYQQSF